jgi:hypothetical protein
MLVAKTMAEWAAMPDHRSDDLVDELIDGWIAAHPEPKPDHLQAAEDISNRIDSWLRANRRPRGNL